ncbi:MAG: hypothetical protein JWQ23_641 [Herminiimonas sp.]|nr:hypothetical protein [Herminiimonas sp.]
MHGIPVNPARAKRSAAAALGALLSITLFLSACASYAPPPMLPTQPQPTIAVTPVVPAVVPAEQAALQTLVSLQDRLYRVAAPLLVNNPELCKGNARNLLGFTAKNKYSYSAELTQAAEVLYGLDERLQVMGVLAGSGAARVGIRRGDKIESVEGKPMPQGPNAERQAATILAPLVGTRPGIRMTMLRDGASIPLTVPLTRACAYSIELGNSDNVNAYNDGRRVMVTRGMINFVRSDDELAFVLAKEMAHNSLLHATKQNMSATVGDIIDNLVRIRPDTTTMAGTSGVRPTPQELDAAADTLSLYMVARAGYDVDQALRFWERLATQYPASVLNGYTAIHPATAYRLAVMDKIVVDLKAKQARKQPLLP